MAPPNQAGIMLADWLNALSHRARLNPDKKAVAGDQFGYTMLELEVAVTSLARQLRETGITPGDQVAVCLERSPLTVAAFLAVLRVGGIYLPIDPRYPSARIAAIQQCGPTAIVTTPSIKKRLPGVDCPAIFAGNALNGPDSGPVEAIDAVDDDYPAYMMLT